MVNSARDHGTAIIFPLSADPIHNGHLYVIDQLMQLPDVKRIYVAIGNNEDKVDEYTFSAKERLKLAQYALAGNQYQEKVVVEWFDGLLADYAKGKQCTIVYRGIRDPADQIRERIMAEFNAARGIDTKYIQASPGVKYIRSTTIKAAVQAGKYVYDMVPVLVQQALQEKLRNTCIVGVTGNSGSGKSTLCRAIQEQIVQTQMIQAHSTHMQNVSGYAATMGTSNCTIIDVDQLVHEIYASDNSIQHQLQNKFGENIILHTSSNEFQVDRSTLADIIFNDTDAKLWLAELLQIPVQYRIEQIVANATGLILIDCAYILEYDLMALVNNNLILTTCSSSEKIRRLMNMGKNIGMNMDSTADVNMNIGRSRDSAEQILRNQLSEPNLEHGINDCIASAGHGHIYTMNTEQTDAAKSNELDALLAEIGQWSVIKS